MEYTAKKIRMEKQAAVREYKKVVKNIRKAGKSLTSMEILSVHRQMMEVSRTAGMRLGFRWDTAIRLAGQLGLEAGSWLSREFQDAFQSRDIQKLTEAAADGADWCVPGLSRIDDTRLEILELIQRMCAGVDIYQDYGQYMEVRVA